MKKDIKVVKNQKDKSESLSEMDQKLVDTAVDKAVKEYNKTYILLGTE